MEDPFFSRDDLKNTIGEIFYMMYELDIDPRQAYKHEITDQMIDDIGSVINQAIVNKKEFGES